MARIAWRTAISGFLLLLATCSEGSAAYVGDRFFSSSLAIAVPTAATLPLTSCGYLTSPTHATFRMLAIDQI